MVGGGGLLDGFVVGVGCGGLMDGSVAVMVLGGLICSCGFRIAGLVGWLVWLVIVGWGFRLQGIFWVSMFWLVKVVGFVKAIDQKCRAQWCGLGLGLGLCFGLLLLCLFQIFGFVFFMWIWWFFWIYEFDFLEVLMEDKDFEWIFACLFAKKMH